MKCKQCEQETDTTYDGKCHGCVSCPAPTVISANRCNACGTIYPNHPITGFDECPGCFMRRMKAKGKT